MKYKLSYSCDIVLAKSQNYKKKIFFLFIWCKWGRTWRLDNIFFLLENCSGFLVSSKSSVLPLIFVFVNSGCKKRRYISESFAVAIDQNHQNNNFPNNSKVKTLTCQMLHTFYIYAINRRCVFSTSVLHTFMLHLFFPFYTTLYH